jgi:hypothetical protein
MESTHSFFEEPRMRNSYSNQLRLNCVPIEQVELNLQSRDRIVTILRALQFLYSDRRLIDDFLLWIASDVNKDSRTDTGRTRMDYWHICVLAAMWLAATLPTIGSSALLKFTASCVPS